MSAPVPAPPAPAPVPVSSDGEELTAVLDEGELSPEGFDDATTVLGAQLEAIKKLPRSSRPRRAAW